MCPAPSSSLAAAPALAGAVAATTFRPPGWDEVVSLVVHGPVRACSPRTRASSPEQMMIAIGPDGTFAWRDGPRLSRELLVWVCPTRLLLALLSFDRPAPAEVWPRRTRRRPRWSAPRSLLLLDCYRRLATRSRDERPGRTAGRRYAPAERRRQGGQGLSAERTPHARAREARGSCTTPPPFSSSPCWCWEGQAPGGARRGRATARRGMRATRVPGGRRRGRAACGPPAGAA
jgi:hypothetical protein